MANLSYIFIIFLTFVRLNFLTSILLNMGFRGETYTSFFAQKRDVIKFEYFKKELNDFYGKIKLGSLKKNGKAREIRNQNDKLNQMKIAGLFLDANIQLRMMTTEKRIFPILIDEIIFGV